MKRKEAFIKGFTDTIPLGISVSIYGVVYGVLGAKTGLSIYTILGLSLFVFAGASQIISVQMLAQSCSVFSIVMTIFIVNLRHYLMAASISPHLSKVSNKMKMVNAYFMTDESYAVSYTHFQKDEASPFYFLGSGLNIYLFWGASGVIGYFFGNFIPKELNYIFDFAFVASFIAMLVPMVKDVQTIAVVIASGFLSIIISKNVPGKWYILIASIAASFVGYFINQLVNRASESDFIGEAVDNES